MGHPKTNELLYINIYIYKYRLYFLTSVNHWNHVLEITRDGFTLVDRQQNDVHWYQASPRPSESPGRAGQQVKEDDVGASPDQEHDQKGTCAEARCAATRAGEGSAKKLSQPWKKDADEPDYTWAPDYSFYNERFKHCLRHHFFVDPWKLFMIWTTRTHSTQTK